MTNTRCDRPGCDGRTDETLFCDTCGCAAGRTAAVGAEERPAEPVTTSRTWQVAGLVELPVLDYGEPTPQPPRQLPPPRARLCRKDGCAALVGGPGPDPAQPALTEGFCHRCGTPFFLTPRLRAGDLLAERYLVDDFLGEGGQGWIYRARDTKLDGAPVALKGLINPNDRDAVQQAISERQFLTELDHPNIVRILDFVTHEDERGSTDYIVMEYLAGQSLRARRRAGARRRQPAEPLDHILAYAHQILGALQYLHERELLYCDMKPENVIRCADRIKVIDLGAVRRVHDRHPRTVGTDGYRVPQEEIERYGLTVRSDLHTFGVTLAELFPERAAEALPESVGVAVESFRHLRDRARHSEHHRRFGSAAELADQLRGVLREYLALRYRQQQPTRSNLFTLTAELLDAGMGTVPSLARWTNPTTGGLLAESRPTGASRTAGLPVPEPAAGDPGAEFLASVVAADPANLVDKLGDFHGESPGVALCGARAHLAGGNLEAALERLTRAEEMLGEDANVDWRLRWHWGLYALAEDQLDVARDAFEEVYRAVPGELAPKLALGLCDELRGDLTSAARYYDAGWQRDRAEASAAFGLARIHLAGGDRSAAVQVLDEVPRVSRHYDAARIAAVRVCFERLSDRPPDRTPPTDQDLAQAQERLPLLHLDAGEEYGESRARLTTALREALLDHLRAAGRRSGPVSEHELRVRLEDSFRTVARQARSPEDHGILVDLANAVRPMTLR